MRNNIGPRIEPWGTAIFNDVKILTVNYLPKHTGLGLLNSS